MTTSKTFVSKTRRVFQVFGHWMTFLSPLVIILAGGLLLFREAVIRAIVSTQHPELVYVILGGFSVGVVLTTLALVRYTKEGNLIHLWMSSYPNPLAAKFGKKLAASYLAPIYAILNGEQPISVAERQQVIEREISGIQLRMQEQLTMPQFLAGALVGLGLVGTFIGLLGTLEDLGKIFSVSPAAGGSNNAVEMFSGMMAQLQAPMRGMGTAFVASLFGLLGSLVLGLQILLAGKVGHSLTEQMHALIRQDNQYHLFEEPLAPAADEKLIQINLGLALQPVMDIVHEMQHMQIKQLENVQLISDRFHQLQVARSEDYQSLRREVLAMTDAIQTLGVAVQQNISADERYRASVPRTSYWQEAWVKVQAYLQRSNIDDSLAHLAETNKAQVHALSAVLKVLSSIENRLRSTQPSK